MIQHNHDLEILKQMAMADGILTENEKELFRSYFQLTDAGRRRPAVRFSIIHNLYILPVRVIAISSRLW